MRTPPTALRPSLAARRFGLRLALFAMLALAMVPTFSRLLQPVGFNDFATLCVSPSSSSGSTPDAHDTNDACALCSLAHTAPAIGAAAAVRVAVVPYAPPAPAAPAAVRTRVAQSRAPGARAPPFTA